MTPFVSANEAVFCLTMILYLLSGIIGILCFAMSISYRLKFRYFLPVLPVLGSLVFFCYLSDAILIRYFGETPDAFVHSLCFMPTWRVILLSVLLFAFVVLWLVLILRKRTSSLTGMSVKEAISQLPVALCFYDETGRLLLLNEKVAEDCRGLTGIPLDDGNAFWSALSGEKVIDGNRVSQSEGSLIVERADGRVILYQRITHGMDGKNVYELCGTDISREFALKKEFEKKNENLRRMNLRLQKYGQIVAEVTRKKEILAARIKVHGNLGSLILRTKKELLKNECDRDLLISDWNDILMLLLAPDEEEEDRFAEVDRNAASVGVHILYSGKRPQRGTQAEKVIANAVFECVTNTARHADGTELYVNTIENKGEYVVTLMNNGSQPEQEIKEGGGLSSLRMMVENAGGKMKIESIPKFLLMITIPKEEAHER